MSEQNQNKTSAIARAVLIDPGMVELLAPFLESRSIALLPVGAKPLVQHWLEQLSDAGVKKVLLLLAHMPEQVRTFVGGGERWGIEVSFATLRENIPFEQQLALAQDFMRDTTFVADLDTLPIQDFQAWLAQEGQAVQGGYACLPERGQRIWKFRSENSRGTGQTQVATTCGENVYRAIRDPRQLWQVNMDLLSGTITDAHPTGFETEKGVSVSRNLRSHPSVKLNAPCVIGENSFLRERAQIGPNAVLGNNVFADVGCSIKDSVIFDHTIIGSLMKLDRVIASGGLLYKIDGEILLHIDDPTLIGKVASDSQNVTLSQRLVALMLLLLLLTPLLLRALLLHLGGKRAWLHETLQLDAGVTFDGRKESRKLQVTSLAVGHPAWRKIPWLWQTALGGIALTGVSPRLSVQGQGPEWTSGTIKLMPGVITLADVTGAGLSGQGSEDVWVTDAYYQATAKGGLDIGLVGQWLVSLFKFY